MNRDKLVETAIALRLEWAWAIAEKGTLEDFKIRIDKYFELRHSYANEDTCNCTFFTCVTVTDTNKLTADTFDTLLAALGVR